MRLVACTSEWKAKQRLLIAVSVLTCILLPVPTASQSSTPTGNDLRATTSEHITLLSINALIGGVTAGLFRLFRGDPVQDAATDGFLRGALGGGITYAGKRVATSDFDGAGFLGREIAALGASTTANASNGIGFFDRLLLPLGPLPARLVITKNGSEYSARPVVDLLSAAGTIYGLAASKYSIDWDASLSGGVAVFRERDPSLDGGGTLDVERVSGNDSQYLGSGYFSGGTSVGSSVLVSHLAPEKEVLAHERVHTIQFDFVTAALSDPADSWMLARAPSVDRWLKLNLLPMAFGAVNQSLVSAANHDSVPWEREAILLSGHR